MTPPLVNVSVRGLLLLAATWSYVIVVVTSSTPANQEPGRETHTAAAGKDSRGLFSPRMDYDEWTPLGRGDPLKNDPTYVYVPPVLERVHYWVDPSSRAPDPPAPGTMPLGQSSMEVRSTHKTTEATAESRIASFVDPFLKFIDGPKFTSTPQQHYYHNQYVMQSPYYHPKPRPSYQQREPYTMLVPPPLQAAATATFSVPQTDATTKTTVEIGKGNLIYHTSTVSDWVEGKTQLATLAAASNQVTWKMAATTTTTTLKPEPPPPAEDMGPLLASLLKNEWTTTPTTTMATTTATMASTTTTPPNIITVTTVPSLTTDPLFSHYKQPAEPMRGPMYLIIQGHSKVKTYGASNAQSYHGIPLQETNDIHQEGEGEIDRSGRGVEDYEDEDSCPHCTTENNNKEEKLTKRKKRQLEIDDLIPLEEAGLLLEDFLAEQSEGSGIGALLADGLSARSGTRTT